jgi:hypothetical protein
MKVVEMLDIYNCDQCGGTFYVEELIEPNFCTFCGEKECMSQVKEVSE